MSSGGRKQALRCILSQAIKELCRREAFYIAELRIEGTICLVSDRSSALIIHLTEQVADKNNPPISLNESQDGVLLLVAVVEKRMMYLLWCFCSCDFADMLAKIFFVF